MGEQDHGLRVEPLSRRPGAVKLPPGTSPAPGIAGHLSGLDADAQRSVAEVLTGQRYNPIVHAAIQAAEASDDTEADRAGAT
jgi:hypothetical protein